MSRKGFDTTSDYKPSRSGVLGVASHATMWIMVVDEAVVDVLGRVCNIIDQTHKALIKNKET